MVRIEQGLVGPENSLAAQNKDMRIIRRELLKAGFGPLLLPPQFSNTFFHNGGRLLSFLGKGMQTEAYGFSFPQKGKPAITRWYPITESFETPANEYGRNNYIVGDNAKKQYKGDYISQIPDTPYHIIRPSSKQKAELKEVQKAAMLYDDKSTYPSDLWLPEAGPATQLATFNSRTGEVVGYLLGFTARDTDGNEWIESQVMGILPDHRNAGIGKALKLQQRDEAIANGFHLIRWTYDPLKVPNTFLNLNRLGGVVRKFLPNHYQFGNSNSGSIPASRFQIDWEITSKHVLQSITGQRKTPAFTDYISNENVFIIDRNYNPDNILKDAKTYLIEIPGNWQDIVDRNPQLAGVWREKSDRIFEQLLETEDHEGTHFIRTIIEDGEGNYYLLAEKNESVTPEVF